MVRITVIYDNEARGGLFADWGFSCLVEAEGIDPILFDTGANGRLLLENMKILGINPKSIKFVFISHPHWDHTGGLAEFLGQNPEAQIFIPASMRAEELGAKARRIKEGGEILEGIFSTGELSGIEQSLIVRGVGGDIVITGCSHPGVEAILREASRWGKVKALIGGFHGFREFRILEELEIIVPCHCTMYKREIKALFPSKVRDCYAGCSLEL